ncbi:uncharacterized protein LOC135811750 [Sycon ciliatum]|uniref:uncharacterized protein LOC135811750 n=1 Tax=Sycon ciliatum TaxID=27933 RepID=UPI0031F5F094
MRCEYAFRYLHQCTNGSYVATLASIAVSFRQGSNQPTQGRVSETGIPGEMSIMWVAQAVKPSLVEYRRVTSEESEHIITASGTSHTYTASDMCNHPANITGSLLFRHPGYIHRVVLRNLAANTEYEYRFGAGTTGIVSAAAEEETITWSPLYQFTTPPDVGSNQAISFFVFGDLGEQRGPTGTPSANRSYTTISRIEDDLFKSPQQFHFVLHVGDISYAEGRGYKWEQFGDLIQSVATRIPYYVGIGNHDYDHVAGGTRDPSGAPDQGYHPSWGVYGDDSGGECAAPIVSRFSMPSTAAQSLQPFWYSHDHGLIHVVWLSTEHDFYPGSDMHKFLVADLDAVNRTRTPWVFVMGHRPMYCSRSVDEITAKDNYIVQLHQRAAYEDVLYRYGVDVFFGGHYHAYERTCPVYNGTCRQSLISGMAEATVHLLVGTGGASQDFDRWDAHPWSRHRGIDYGYARVHVANGTHLRVQYVRNEDGSVADDAWIVSRHGWHL